jgi:hypothetical protein
VLLILAGVTISTVFGDNGIINKAREAADKTNQAIKNEQDELNKLYNELENAMNGGEEPISGNINGKTTWSIGSATLELTTDISDVIIQYRKNEESTWINYSSPILGLLHGEKIYAQGLKGGEIIIQEKEFNIIDTVSPIVRDIITGEITENSITVTVNAVDNESGLITDNTYKYYLNGEEKITSASNSYTFAELVSGTEYTIKVEAFDRAGLKGEKTIIASTNRKTVFNTLKVGDYVNYLDGKGNPRKCVVLYDRNSTESNNEVQIITMDTVEDVSLGSIDFDESIKLYNSSISTLNNKADEYKNTNFSSMGRCVGSVPNNPSSESGMYNGEGLAINKNFKDKDTNYGTDYNKMKLINGGIHNIERNYWLASRDIYVHNLNRSQIARVPEGINVYFSMNYIETNGNLVNSSSENCLSNTHTGGAKSSKVITYGLRPVFNLKDLKVISGDGTENNPYNITN